MTNKFRALWSPEQIARWLKHTYSCDESHQVSHETIYRSLFIQTRGALKKELLQHLRRTRGMRRFRHRTHKTDTLTSMTYRVWRSTSVAIWLLWLPKTRSPSQWPGIARSSIDAGRSLIETAPTICPWINGKNTETVVNALIKNAQKLLQRALQIVALGSRQRDGWPQAPHARLRHPGLLL